MESLTGMLKTSNEDDEDSNEDNEDSDEDNENSGEDDEDYGDDDEEIDEDAIPYHFFSRPAIHPWDTETQQEIQEFVRELEESGVLNAHNPPDSETSSATTSDASGRADAEALGRIPEEVDVLQDRRETSLEDTETTQGIEDLATNPDEEGLDTSFSAELDLKAAMYGPPIDFENDPRTFWEQVGDSENPLNYRNMGPQWARCTPEQIREFVARWRYSGVFEPPSPVGSDNGTGWYADDVTIAADELESRRESDGTLLGNASRCASKILQSAYQVGTSWSLASNRVRTWLGLAIKCFTGGVSWALNRCWLD